MIAKHIPIRSLKKSDFANLVNYITDSQGNIERVGAVSFTNCHAANIDIALTEIIATQQMNTRSKSDKTFHLIVSFRPGENPSSTILKDVETSIAADLGFAEHQRVSVVHYDTDNVHMHIAINKIHPDKFIMVEPFQSYRKLSNSCRALEIKHSLETDNHITKQINSAGRANDMERHSGIESLVGWIRRVCINDIKAADSWTKLHDTLAVNGLVLHKKGNGLVIEGMDSGVFVKASTVDRVLSKTKLEQKLGPFEALDNSIKVKQRYEKRPLRTRVNTDELYNVYRAEQEFRNRFKLQEYQRLRENKSADLVMLNRLNRLKRVVIANSKNYLMRKVLYQQLNRSLRTNIKKINQKYKAQKTALKGRHLRLTWADWLREQAEAGNIDALKALRGRKDHRLQGNTLSGNDLHQMEGTVAVTKGGTVTYQAGATAGIRDDGQHLKIARNINADGVIAALKLAQARFGNTLQIDGTEAFKTLIIKAAVVGNVNVTFSDAALEQQKFKLLMEKQNNVIQQRIRENRQSARRFDSYGNGSDGFGAADRNNARSWRRGNGNRPEQKPDAGAFRAPRSNPATTGYNSVRQLSDINVASIVQQSPMLLQGDARNYMDKRQPRGTADALRWDVFHTQLTTEQKAAAEQYIKERMEKRTKGMAIPEHRPLSRPMKAKFLGGRNINGVTLLLVGDVDTAVYVLPVSTPKRFKVGDTITISQAGVVSRARKMKK